VSGGTATQERIAFVTGDFWAITSARPALGRLFGEQEADELVLSWLFYQRRFGGDPRTIGTNVTLAGHPFRIAGVLRPDFQFGFPQQYVPGDEVRGIDGYIAIPSGILALPNPLPAVLWEETQRRLGPSAHAVYVIARLKAGLTYEQAAALPQAGAIALQGIRDAGRVRPGQKVLINGGGGGSGMYAVQLARLDGAEVTGVDNAEKLEFMRSLGADHVIDYAREDFTRNGPGYDLILDLAAYRPASAYRRSLLPGGRYLYVGGSVATLLQVLTIGPVIGRAGRKRIRLLAVRLGVQHLDPLVELIRAGTITTVIDRRFALSEVPEALRYLGEGHAKGKVVITVG